LHLQVGNIREYLHEVVETVYHVFAANLQQNTHIEHHHFRRIQHLNHPPFSLIHLLVFLVLIRNPATDLPEVMHKPAKMVDPNTLNHNFLQIGVLMDDQEEVNGLELIEAVILTTFNRAIPQLEYN
jgi:hypothetical protein